MTQPEVMSQKGMDDTSVPLYTAHVHTVHIYFYDMGAVLNNNVSHMFLKITFQITFIFETMFGFKFTLK